MAPVIYDLTIGVYIRALKQLSVVLQKGEQWATENNASEQLVECRLAPDMFQLPFQVHAACSTSLATLDNATPPAASEGNDFASLQENIRLTLEKLEAIDPQSWTGKEDTEVFIKGRVENWDVEMIPFMQVRIPLNQNTAATC